MKVLKMGYPTIIDSDQWKIRFRERGGHKIFVDSDGKYAIADQSGYTPDQTDDGVLYINTDRAIVVDRINLFGNVDEDYRISICLPVGKTQHVPISTKMANWIIKNIDIGVKFGVNGDNILSNE